MASVILNGSTSGSVTISSPAVSGTTTLTLPTTSGTVITTGSTFAGTGPAFSAYADGTQSGITSGTATKVLFATEEFDTTNNFASSRFTPTVAGYYQINTQYNCTATTITRVLCYVYKNGSNVKTGSDTAGSVSARALANCLIYCNGSTDYIEIYAHIFGTGSIVVTTGPNDSYFQAAMIRSA